jgi:Rifampin ADP-ribosyl transferase
MAAIDDLNSQRFYHGTKADLKRGDLIEPGYNSNFGKRKKAAYVYLTATLDAATWGAELALGEGPGRIYMVKPTGPIEDDPNLTDKKYPGNPTKSYRSRDPLRVTGEVTDWQGHSPEELKAMKDNLERLRRLGVEAIEDRVRLKLQQELQRIFPSVTICFYWSLERVKGIGPSTRSLGSYCSTTELHPPRQDAPSMAQSSPRRQDLPHGVVMQHALRQPA